MYRRRRFFNSNVQRQKIRGFLPVQRFLAAERIDIETIIRFAVVKMHKTTVLMFGICSEIGVLNRALIASLHFGCLFTNNKQIVMEFSVMITSKPARCSFFRALISTLTTRHLKIH